MASIDEAAAGFGATETTAARDTSDRLQRVTIETNETRFRTTDSILKAPELKDADAARKTAGDRENAGNALGWVIERPDAINPGRMRPDRFPVLALEYRLQPVAARWN